MLTNPNGSMKLYEFVIIFGCFMLILAQVPSFHSLRHINFVALVLCLAYSVCATAGSAYIGKSNDYIRDKFLFHPFTLLFIFNFIVYLKQNSLKYIFLKIVFLWFNNFLQHLLQFINILVGICRLSCWNYAFVLLIYSKVWWES